MEAAPPRQIERDRSSHFELGERKRGPAHGIALAALAQPVELPEAGPHAQRGDGQRDEHARDVAPTEPHGPTRGRRFSAASRRWAADRLGCRSS